MRQKVILSSPILVLAVAATASAQDQDAPPSPPPAPRALVVPPPAPPPIRTVPSVPAVNSTNQAARFEPMPIAIEIIGGSRLLWQGELRLGDYRASYSANSSEAPEACPSDKQGILRNQTSNNSVKINISRRASPSGSDELLGVNISWTRAGLPCEGGSSTVGFERNIALGPGAMVELAGDGGLIVRLSRKQ